MIITILLPMHEHPSPVRVRAELHELPWRRRERAHGLEERDDDARVVSHVGKHLGTATGGGFGSGEEGGGLK